MPGRTLLRRMDKRRVEAFSDGVFAIAMTLLVLEIRRPSAGDPHSLATQLRDHWPSYLAYVTSFLQLAVVWVNHHQVFDHIRRANTALLFLNSLFLMVICVSPFPMAVVAEFLDSGRDERGAVLLYGSTFTLMAILFSVLWYYAALGGRLIDPAMRESARQITRRFVPGVPIYTAGTLVAFLSPLVSVLIFTGLAILYAIPYERAET